jgi:hypothetical protein
VFDGVVRYSDLPDSLSVEETVSGSVTYETTGENISLPPNGTYVGVVSAFELTIGDYEAGPLLDDGWNNLYIRDFPTQDLLFLETFLEPDALFPNSPIVSLSLRTDTPGVITGPEIPTAPPSLSDVRPFSIEDWQSYGYATGLQFYTYDVVDRYVWIELTRLEGGEPVPEPWTLALLSLAGPALGRRLLTERARRR